MNSLKDFLNNKSAQSYILNNPIYTKIIYHPNGILKRGGLTRAMKKAYENNDNLFLRKKIKPISTKKYHSLNKENTDVNSCDSLKQFKQQSIDFLKSNYPNLTQNEINNLIKSSWIKKCESASSQKTNNFNDFYKKSLKFLKSNYPNLSQNEIDNLIKNSWKRQ